MIDLWRRLETHLRKHVPDLFSTLNPPASDADIAAAEKAMGVRFPADFAASLRVHDGQRFGPEVASLVPEVYDPSRSIPGGVLYSLSQITERHRRRPTYRGTSMEGRFRNMSDEERAALAKRGINAEDVISQGAAFDELLKMGGAKINFGRALDFTWIDFVDGGGSGDILALDLEPDAKGRLGQVIVVNHDPPEVFGIAPGFRPWFEFIVKGYESGQFVVEREDGSKHPGLFKVGQIIQVWDRENPECPVRD